MHHRQRLVPAALTLVFGLVGAACGGSDDDGQRSEAETGAIVTAPADAAGRSTPGGGPSTTAASRLPALDPNQKVSITWETYNLAQAAHVDTIKTMVSEFEQTHPNIDVTAQPPQGSTEELAASVQAQVVAGNAPDVVQMTFADLGFTADALGAKNLDDLVGTDAVDAAFGGEHPFHPRTRVLGDWKGSTYGMPYVFSTPTLFYNADLFRAAGLDPAKPPTNWAEVKQQAQAIKAATGKDGAYIGCVGQGAVDWCLQGIILSNGGRTLSEDGTRLMFDQPPATQALATWQDLVQSGASPNLGIADATAAFSRGELGMYLQTSALQGSFSTAAKDKWELRAAQMPGFGSRPAVPTNSGSALFILADDEAEQAASWELIKFLTSDRAYDLIASNIGYLPLRNTLIDDPAHLKGWADANPLVKPNAAQLDRLQPWQAFPGDSYQQARKIFTDAAEQVVYRGADPARTMSDAQQRAAALLPAN